tara:strand:+ start:16 stop:633 length:618 start_codon:yes stop_codon:yes gene_type:complete
MAPWLSMVLIHALFATPVYVTELNRKLTSKETNFKKIKQIKNYGNYKSNDSYILNTKQFSNIKKELDIAIKDYFNKIISPKNKITPYITQSWLNYTDTNEHHHKHNHPNSLVSGILYLNANEKFDKVEFYRDDYNMIKPEIKNFNFFNSESWWLPVKTGQIMLFPSSLSHSVSIKKGTNNRVSLAFNVFIKGGVGSLNNLTRLVL